MDKKGFVESMIRAIASQDDAIECWMHLKDAADSIGGLERRFYNLNGLNRVKSFVESELIRIKAEKDHCA